MGDRVIDVRVTQALHYGGHNTRAHFPSFEWPQLNFVIKRRELSRKKPKEDQKKEKLRVKGLNFSQRDRDL